MIFQWGKHKQHQSAPCCLRLACSLSVIVLVASGVNVSSLVCPGAFHVDPSAPDQCH